MAANFKLLLIINIFLDDGGEVGGKGGMSIGLTADGEGVREGEVGGGGEVG